MADNSKNMVNCRILVRDSKTGDLIADTTIEEFDAKLNTLTIPEASLHGAANGKLALLVLGKNGVLEYSGNLRKIMSGAAEIALFGEREKEDRNFTRYEMKAEGRVEAILIDGERIDLRKPIPISVINISANGILFKGDIDAFRRGSRIRLRVGIKDNAFISEYEVVRSQNRNKESAEYGCRNILPEGEQNNNENMENISPKQLREDAARNRMKNRKEIEDTERIMAFGEDGNTYDVLQHQMEKVYGYTGWLKKVAELQAGGEIDAGASQDKLQALIDDIYLRALELDVAIILNCIHRKRPEEEQRVRHTLNLALISALMGKWLHFEEQMIKKLIAMGLFEETGENTQEENAAPTLYIKIMSVAELYDSRASHPNHEKAGIPLVFLEQMRYRGLNQPLGSMKMLEWVLAENILHCINQRMVLLANNTIGKLLYVLPNDVGHPIIAMKKEIYQEMAPWNLLWIIVKPNAAQEE